MVRAGAPGPVAHARIVAARVGGPANNYLTAVTDEAGRFAFQSVAPGTYRVYASRDGYLQAEYGRHPAGTAGIPVVLADGQQSPDLIISMTPTGAIAGRVLDRGKPVRNAWVRALKATYVDGERRLAVAEWAQTDDRGEYRVFGLAPGFYVVSAIPQQKPRIEEETLVVPVVPSNANQNQREIRAPLALGALTAAAFDRGVYPAVYHPGTTDPSAAQPVEVRAGETVSGIDFIVVTTKTYRVRGSVVGGGSSAVRVGLTPIDSGTRLPIPDVEATDGSFELRSVPPGRYDLSADTTDRDLPLTRAATQIDVVDRDVEGATITLIPGVKVSGQLSIDGRPPSSSDPPIFVQLQPGYSAVRVQPDGTFVVENVSPRDYSFRVLQIGRTPWVKSAQFGGEAVLNAPIRVGGDLKGRQLEIVLGANGATLDAQVVDANQRPVSGVLVIAVPDAARRNQSQAYRTATTDADGRARLDSLAPGDYTLFASESIEAGAWQDPAVLRRYESRGTAVHVREGAAQTVTLRISS